MPIASIAATVSSLSSARDSPSMEYHGLNGTHQLAQDDFAFDPVEDALAAFKQGQFVVVMDDNNRENEGDLICAASLITTEKMAWFIKHSSGYICISLPGDRLDELQLPPMVPNNEEKHKTAYTVTVDYKHGTSTGISAHDRALTARMLASSTAVPTDFNRPGHLCPLRAREGGVLTRRGHTEAGLDLCHLTSLPPAALLCELVNDDDQGTMSRRDDCRAFADEWGLKMISIAQLADLRRALEQDGKSYSRIAGIGSKEYQNTNGYHVNGSH